MTGHAAKPSAGDVLLPGRFFFCPRAALAPCRPILEPDWLPFGIASAGESNPACHDLRMRVVSVLPTSRLKPRCSPLFPILQCIPKLSKGSPIETCRKRLPGKPALERSLAFWDIVGICQGGSAVAPDA